MRLVLLAAFLLVAQDPIPKYPKHFESKEVGDVTVEAVCSIYEDHVTCWDTNGISAPTKAVEVKSALGKNVNGVRFAFGEINRYVVVRINSLSDAALSVQTYGNPSAKMPQYVAQLETPQPKPGETWVNRSIYWIEVDDSSQAMSVPFGYWVPFKGSFDLKAEKGSTASVGDRSVTFRISRPGYGPNSRPMDTNRRQDFELLFNAKGIPETSTVLAAMLDASGEAIQAVDASGKAVEASLQLQEDAERQSLFNMGSAVPEKKYWRVDMARLRCVEAKSASIQASILPQLLQSN